MENSPEAKRAWNEKFRRDGLPDHSRCDWHLALEAMRAGWSDGEIAALITEFRTKVGESDKATPHYVGLTIAKARQALATGVNNYDDEMFGATQAIEAGDKSAAIQALGDRLGTELDRIVITGIEQAVAYNLILTNGRRVDLGGATALLSQGKVRAQLLAAANTVMRPAKPSDWDSIIRAMLALAEREEAADSDPVRALLGGVDEYADQYPPADWEEDSDGTFARSKPMLKNGRLHISVRDFMFYSARRGDGELKASDVRRLLRVAGWDGVQLTRRIGPKTVGRYYWQEPVTENAAL
jgi:hypothetical protein